MEVKREKKFTVLNRTFVTLGALCLLLNLSSCIPNFSAVNNKKNTEQEESTAESGGKTINQPVFEQKATFFDNGTSQSYSIFEINIDSGINLLLRGSKVHEYLSLDGKASEVVCMVTSINESVDNKWVVIAASPGQLYDYSNSAKEFYYSLSINNETLNRTFCQKPGLITELSNQKPLYSIAYSLNSICSSCTQSYLNSSAITMYLSSGASLGQVSTENLKLKLKNTPTTSTESTNSCDSSSQCQAEGYDCCGSDGYCISDKSLKDGVDQSSTEFLQAQNDIVLAASNIYKYTNFFNLCPVAVVDDTPTSSQEVTPEEAALALYTERKDLYECTTLLKGEMSVCAVNYENASKAASNIFVTLDDDRNFTTTYSGMTIIPQHSIVEVSHAGETLFKDGTFYAVGEVKIGANNSMIGNDSLGDPGIIELYRTLPETASHDTLKIKYKIDGSCELVNSQVAKCSKYYIQGQNSGDVDDHYPASNSFALPDYVDLNKTLAVTVEGTTKFKGTHWTIDTTNGIKVVFSGASLQVYDNQEVIITYFVDLNSNNVFNSKKIALEQIRDMCGCADLACRLKPQVTSTNGVESISDYTCDFPDKELTPAPLQQTIMLSAKTVPMRYYDENGAAHSDIDLSTPEQEGSKFKYISNDLLRPNNVTQDIGIGEVYGSFTRLSESAKPAEEIRVDVGKVYDIYVDSGTFSSCFNCGVDYHSLIAKMFPSNFLHRGGGWQPQPGLTNRKTSTEYRGDDILFGRACFIPATMLPWTHKPESNLQTQRQSRLAAQHFLFANGLNRDWYGFDYGSVIGSFDGVKWFSIGNQRRIKAEGNKLFLAINGYFGDLTMESTFQVTVVDSSVSTTSVGAIQSDFESDGAQCQKYHVCQTDADCVSNLGWEYKCENINSISSNWPLFDSLANEIPDQEQYVRLYSLFKASAGGTKRCVYRSRGTPCHQDMTFASTDQSFNASTSPGLLSCSQNNYCQEFIQGSLAKKFNTKIARFGKAPSSQNASNYVSESTLDTFGLHTRYIGRPYDYIGTQEIPAAVLNNFSHNDIVALCLPGRDPEASTNISSLAANPASTYQGDKVLGMGMTVDALQDPRFLSSCPVIDSDENFYHFKSANISSSLDAATNAELYNLSAGQNLSSAHIEIFESILGRNATEIFESKQITSRTMEKNRCLRSPGATCFTDLDCSNSDYFSTFISAINANDSTAQSIVNKNEILFWQEKLVCSQAAAPTDSDYDHTLNKCCRELGKDINIPTYINQTGYTVANTDSSVVDFDNTSIPGVDISLDSKRRYSRNSVVHYEKSQNATKYPVLEVVGQNKCEEGGCENYDNLNNQFNTLDLYASKTCCSGHWIRNFHTDNGAGHRWSPTKMQTFDKTNLRCYNWAKYDGTQPADAQNFSCSHVEDPDDPGCFVRNLTQPLYNPILDLMSEIELLGIPQATVKSEDFDNMACTTDIYNQFSGTTDSIVPGVFAQGTGKAEYVDGSGYARYSARDKNNFDSDLKMVFSEDKLTCCLPAGTEVASGADRDMCCSGFIDESSNKCALPDYTDLSVYFNRYVSSATKNLSDTLFDTKTGYFKDVTTAITLACQLQVCASNTVALGVAVSNISVPGHENSIKKYKRFIDGDETTTNNKNGLADLFNAGLKWNNHAYCVPQDIPVDTSDLVVTQCQ